MSNAMTATHFFINNTFGKGVVIKTFPCADCDTKVRVDARATRCNQRPVLHAFQAGTCPSCRAPHFVISASNTDDCVKLEPYLRECIQALQVEQDAPG